MLTLLFGEAGPAAPVVRGPFPHVRADAVFLRSPDGERIAQHRDHCWYIGAQRYFRIDCEGPVNVHFEGPNGARSPEFGPFFHFSSADGVAYGDGQIVGHLDVDACF